MMDVEEKEKTIEDVLAAQAVLHASLIAMRKSNKRMIFFVIAMSLVEIFSIFSMFIYFLPEDFAYYFDAIIKILYLFLNNA